MMSADTRWVKSSYSFANGNCVEVAALPGAVAVRDSKDPGGPVLTFPDQLGAHGWPRGGAAGRDPCSGALAP